MEALQVQMETSWRPKMGREFTISLEYQGSASSWLSPDCSTSNKEWKYNITCPLVVEKQDHQGSLRWLRGHIDFIHLN